MDKLNKETQTVVETTKVEPKVEKATFKISEAIQSFISFEHRTHRPILVKLEGVKSFDEAKAILVEAGFIIPVKVWNKIQEGPRKWNRNISRPRDTKKATTSDMQKSPIVKG